MSGKRIPPSATTHECQWPGCELYAWATPERVDGFFAPGGTSQIKQTKNGGWACEGHAFAVGGGWVEPEPEQKSGVVVWEFRRPDGTVIATGQVTMASGKPYEAILPGGYGVNMTLFLGEDS